MAIREVKIKATAKAGKKEDLSIEPALLRMRGTGWGEQIKWIASGRITSFVIDFNYGDGSPFKDNSNHDITHLGPSDNNKELLSPTPSVSGQNVIPYAYTITAQLSAGQHRARQIVLDPEVEIDDSTPPPGTGGKKKAAKKAVSKKGARKKAAKRRPPKKR